VKTLHLTSAWHEQSGGIATFYKELMAAANRNGRHLILVVPAAEDSIEQVGDFGKIYHVAAPVAPLNSSYRILYPSQFIPSRSKIQQIIAHERPDLVEICDKYNLNYLGALLRLGMLRQIGYRPPVVGLSCERMDDNFGAYLGGGAAGKYFSRFYMQWLYFPFFDYHIANSSHTADELVPAAKGHPVSRSVWIRPMGVDVARFSPSKRTVEGRAHLLRRCKGDRDSALLLYAGRLAPEKNLNLLVQLMEQLSLVGPQFRLIIAGQGMDENRLRALAEARVPGQITFLGHVGDREQLAELYANCDVFLHPNPHEPFGIAPLEAMAAGLPLVAPNSGGVTSYANTDNAWVVEPTGTAFARAVYQALTDEPLRLRRIRAALQTAQQFSWPNITILFFDLYGEIIRRHSGEAATPGMEPAFVSTDAAKVRNRMVEGAAGVAKLAFSAWIRWMDKSATSMPLLTHAPNDAPKQTLQPEQIANKSGGGR
jgi:alpha-1,6-mannosyltransferase